MKNISYSPIPVLIVMMAVLLNISSCDDDRFDERQTFLNEDILEITVTQKDISADNFTRIPVEVSFLIDAVDRKFRVVEFSSEGGRFDPKSIFVEDEDTSVDFIPGLSTGEFEITATVKENTNITTSETIILAASLSSDILEIAIDTGKDTVRANGIDLVEGNVTLSETEERTVILKTTDGAGLFLPDKKSEITLEVPSDGIASFKLNSSTTAGNYLIEAKLEDERQLKVDVPYTLRPTLSAEVIDLQVNETQATANGLNRLTGTVMITNTLLDEVTFSSTDSGGRFLGLSEGNKLVVDQSGMGTFEYVVSQSVGTHKLIAKIGSEPMYVDEHVFDLTALGSEDILELVFQDVTNVLANGGSIVTGTVSIIDYPISNISLTTNLGEFVANEMNTLELEIDDSGSRDFELKVGTKAESHRVDVSLTESIKISRSFDTNLSYPESLVIVPKSFEIDSAGGNVSIDVFFQKTIGKTSESIPLIMTATQGGSDVGIFKTFPIESGPDQKATVNYSLETRRANIGTPITIEAIASDGLGGLVRNSIELTVISSE